MLFTAVKNLLVTYNLYVFLFGLVWGLLRAIQLRFELFLSINRGVALIFIPIVLGICVSFLCCHEIRRFRGATSTSKSESFLTSFEGATSYREGLYFIAFIFATMCFVCFTIFVDALDIVNSPYLPMQGTLQEVDFWKYGLIVLLTGNVLLAVSGCMAGVLTKEHYLEVEKDGFGIARNVKDIVQWFRSFHSKSANRQMKPRRMDNRKKKSKRTK